MGRRIVARQRQIIRLRRIRGESTREFEATLDVFERTLKSFEDDLEWMLGNRPANDQRAASTHVQRAAEPQAVG